ncbi:MAG: C4-dicarboxylate ABC transporter permease [Dethiosulfovibrio peptidovorans]|nr:MAG: C4-dicarboxylate ABC transporter permease [Dethiosulfovibrio peptidovorans]
MVKNLNVMLAWACGVGILIMGLILFYEVVMRYFFNSPTVWTQEVSIYIFIWCMFGGASYTLQKGKHVNIDLLTSKLSKNAQSTLRLITAVAGILFCSEVAYSGWHMVYKAVQYNKHSPTPLQVPIWIPQSAILVGFFLLTMQFVVIVIDEVCSLHLSNRPSSDKGGLS